MIPVYALYCQELPEREKGLRDHLEERGVKAIYFRGFHGNTWGIRTTKPYAPNEYISPGHVGLDMGTWSMWQHIYLSGMDADGKSNPVEPIITLEDDVELPEDFWNTINTTLKELNTDFPEWDLVLLGLAECEPHVWHKVVRRVGRPNSKFCVLNEPFGTHAIMLRRKALPILLNNMRIAERNLDQQLWQYVLKDNKLNWCAVLPTMIRQRTFDYTGSGKVQWAPSCIDPLHVQPEEQAPALQVREQDLKRMAGMLPPERPSAELIEMTNLVVDPYPCIYRGEPLEEFGKPRKGRGSVPLAQCARLNRACHSKNVDLEVRMDGEPVKSCQTCELRVQMSSERTRPKLELPSGHFNPSMILWKDRLIFATRDSWGHSKVALWQLWNERADWSGNWSILPIGSYASDHFEAPRLEDPRLFVVPDPDTGSTSLCCMFNLPDNYPPKRVQVGYVKFDQELTEIIDTEVFHSPANNLYEKNWVPFHDGKELRWVYNCKPDHVVLGMSGDHHSPNNLPWTGGFIRGGATPFLVPASGDSQNYPEGSWSKEIVNHSNRQQGSCYYHFFHGCLKRVAGSVYTMGCNVFEAKPPFRVIRQTPIPLIWPDLPAANEDVTKRYVVWPGGAVPHAGHWHIALGIDDTFCRIVRIPFAEVEKALKDVPEAGKATSLRDTPMATGQKG